MKSYIISYDLINKEIYDYTDLISYIKTYGKWAKPLESFWLIKTDKSVSTVRDELKAKVSSGDKILVIDVTGSYWATSSISKEVTDWMKNNI